MRKRRYDLETAPRPADGWKPSSNAKRPLYVGSTTGDAYNYVDLGDGVYGLQNQRTGEVGTPVINGVEIYGKRTKPKTYASAFDGSLAGNMDVLNAMTGGVLNRLSPTQNLRLLYDVANGHDWRSSWMGNNGVVSDSFAKAHPLMAMALNGVADVAPAGGIKTLSGLAKMRGRKLGYTGVSPENTSDFKLGIGNSDYDIWTANKKRYADHYGEDKLIMKEDMAKDYPKANLTDAKENWNGQAYVGETFKVYGKPGKTLEVPTPNGMVLDWQDLPVHADGNKLVLDNLYDVRIGDIYGAGKNKSLKYAKTFPEFRAVKEGTMPTHADSKYNRYGYVRTNEAVDFAKQKGYNSTTFKNVDDGVGIGNVNDIVDEIVYHPNADIITAPANEHYVVTALKNGKSYNPLYGVPITTSNIYRNNKKRVGGSLVSHKKSIKWNF